MTRTDVARLLTLIAAIDRRTIGETDVESWHLLLGHLDVDDCVQAVREHFTTGHDWLMPDRIITLATSYARRRAGRARLAQLEAERLAIEAAPLDTEPVKVIARRRIKPAGQPVLPADYRDQDLIEARRREYLAALEAMPTEGAK